MVSYKPDRCTPWNQQNSLLSPADRRRKAAAPPEGMSDATLKSRQTAISSDQPSKQSSQTLYYPDSSTSEAKQWDIFRLLPPPPDSTGRGFWYAFSLQVLKISCFFVLFILTLTSATIAKSAFLLMTSAIGSAGHNVTICNDKIPEGSTNRIRILPQHVVKWVWAVYLSLCIPEIICFIRSLHRTLFRNVKRPTVVQFLVVFIIESLHAAGIGILVFRIFPNIDAVTAAMLTNSLCLILCILSLLSRKPKRLTMLLIFFDLGCIVAQSTDFWAWPALNHSLYPYSWTVPVSLLLISLAWWPNFVHPQSMFPPIRALANFAITLNETRSKTYVFVSVWKCLIYLLAILLFIPTRLPFEQLVQSDPFGEKIITISAYNMNQTQLNKFYDRMKETESYPYYEESNSILPTDEDIVDPMWLSNADPDYMVDKDNTNKRASNHGLARVKRYMENGQGETISAYNIFDDYVELNEFTSPYDALWMVLVQVVAVVLCYHSSKFACKVMMQRIGFALPMLLTVPATVFVLSSMCQERDSDSCYLTWLLSKELFWNCQGRTGSLKELMLSPQTWIWLCWLISQFWITIHLWMPKHERLAKTEKLFMLFSYSGPFVDQALAFSRRRDDKVKILAEDLEPEVEDLSTYETISGITQTNKTTSSVCSALSSRVEDGLIREAASSADAIPKIYACATMWHESAIEMTCMLKSIFRLDEDQCARRNAQKYLKVIDPDYYEFEAHILFDDAFQMNDYGEAVINKFVKQFIEKVDEAASAVHQTRMRLKTPKKITTPYGGRISYLLPGRNRMTVHLKDKMKIRHRKRWSQVMYLYYLLGYRLMMKVDDETRKEVISENTFILTLDGDVDFTPQCVHLLVDLMKKDRRLGAACGRIHPRGAGLMVWYQKFEYAIGHWLQKATEHMIGCVLCSPGCFSLFRAYALMDDNVTRRYATKSENPIDYIQYDQGEDRWLCTLLLQRGYRVEYCAASDALTFAPEGFSEYFNQRRRWIPSTLANIVDLLKDYKNVVTVNESISIWYIIYQCVMFVSSVLGPGTIFLMIVGAISISFNIDTILALIVVTLPMALFCTMCLVGKPEKQLLVAEIIGALFAMLMTAVIVGTSLQIQKDGILSPHSIFSFAVIASFLTAAILHPLEFTCIIPGMLYFLAIPCMYMLLPIYSLCNMNTVSWGTREEPKVETKKAKSTPTKRFDIVESDIGNEADGQIVVGCGSACRILCCLKPDTMETSPQIWRINEKLSDIERKLDRFDRRSGAITRRSSALSGSAGIANDKWTEIEEDEQAELDDNRDMSNQSAAAMRNRKWKSTANESWLNERLLKRAEREYLDAEEESFWSDVIEMYLTPIAIDPKEQQRIQIGLTELRNKVCSGFFMVNVVYITIVLVLQMQKDCLHIEWPLGPKFNHTIIPCNSDSREEVWVMTRLQLEPIGLVFLVFFMSILIIQFLAMLMHRFGTLEHIIASTELFCRSKAFDKLSEEELVVQNAVEIARELQAIRGIDESDDQTLPEERPISRRRVVQNLESSRRSMMKHRTDTLDAAFKKRFFALSSDKIDDNNQVTSGFGSREKRLTLRKGTIRAIEQRRNSLFGTIDKRRGAAATARQDESPTSPTNPTSPAEPTNHSTAISHGPAQRRLERLFNRDEPSHQADNVISDQQQQRPQSISDLFDQNGYANITNAAVDTSRF